jgi:hypothetical protein
LATSWFGASSRSSNISAGLWWENAKERDRLEELNLEGTIKLKCIFKTLNGTAWTGLIWLRIGTGGGLL